MGLFGAKKRGASVSLIDIDSSSVGGALASYIDGSPAAIHYALRLPIERREKESVESAMLRTLEACVKQLVQKGAPVLRRATGSGHSDQIYVRISSPLQQTLIRKERIEDPKQFIFSRAIMHDVLKKGANAPAGFQNSEERIIAVLLNGYETDEPLGKKVKYADLIVLSSFVEKKIAAGVQNIIRSAYHTHSLTVSSFASVAYLVFRKLFPHEKNFIVLEVSGESIDMAYIKGGQLVKTASHHTGVNTLIRSVRGSSHKEQFQAAVDKAEKEWVEDLKRLLQEMGSEQALPRTVFLVCTDDAREYVARLLNDSELRTFWLSDDPLRVISIAQKHLSSRVTTGPDAEADTNLSLLAIFAAQQDTEPGF